MNDEFPMGTCSKLVKICGMIDYDLLRQFLISESQNALASQYVVPVECLITYALIWANKFLRGTLPSKFVFSGTPNA